MDSRLTIDDLSVLFVNEISRAFTNILIKVFFNPLFLDEKWSKNQVLPKLMTHYFLEA
jgi:hypothetical protein